MSDNCCSCDCIVDCFRNLFTFMTSDEMGDLGGADITDPVETTSFEVNEEAKDEALQRVSEVVEKNFSRDV